MAAAAAAAAAGGGRRREGARGNPAGKTKGVRGNGKDKRTGNDPVVAETAVDRAQAKCDELLKKAAEANKYAIGITVNDKVHTPIRECMEKIAKCMETTFLSETRI